MRGTRQDSRPRAFDETPGTEGAGTHAVAEQCTHLRRVNRLAEQETLPLSAFVVFEKSELLFHGNLHPHRLEFAQQVGARCDIVHQDAFGQLELYMGPIYTGDIEDRNCVREKVPMGSRRGNEHGRENLVV